MKIIHSQKIPGELKANDHPYLNGAHTPLLEEVDAEALDVIEGAIPRDLDGVYLRALPYRDAGALIDVYQTSRLAGGVSRDEDVATPALAL